MRQTWNLVTQVAQARVLSVALAAGILSKRCRCNIKNNRNDEIELIDMGIVAGHNAGGIGPTTGTGRGEGARRDDLWRLGLFLGIPIGSAAA